MTPESIFEIATWSVGLGLPFAAAWWGTAWIRKRWARVYARVLITPALMFATALPIGAIAGSSFERGEWRCTICGASEYQLRLGSRCLLSGSRSDPSGRGFEGWYVREIRQPHGHDWSLAQGCHFSGSAVGCHFDAGGAYFSAIPHLPSTAIAVSMVLRMQRASSSERLDLIRGFPRAEMDEPFASLRKGASMTSEQFAGDYSDWLQTHPEWR
jgi:hypothetical protein